MSRLCVLAGVVLVTVGFLRADATLAALGFVLGMLGAVELTLREREQRRCP
ncbi:MAG: hypothetical protein QOE65_1281 [Solirubrobacteraceae bacterium]|jgi:uncharacterized membrane protein|nr:hypothetical protein [Solirubrobacteraceae bacterium]